MKTILLLLIICFCVTFANSQTVETIGELTPITTKSLSFNRFANTFPKSEYSNIKFDINVESVILPDKAKAIAIIIKASNKELVYENYGPKLKAFLEIYGRITSKDKSIDGYFREKLVIEVNETDLEKTMEKSVSLRKMFLLKKGKYRLGVIFRDSYDRGKKVVKFQIP